MPAPGYRATLIEAQGDGTAVTLVAEASLLPAQAKLILPGGYIDKIGKKFCLRAQGRVSNVVTTPGTLTLRFKLGPTANIIAAASKAIALNIVAKANVGWHLDWYFTARAIGGGATALLMHNGIWVSESVVGAPAGQSASAVLQDAPVVGTGFDSTVANLIDLAAIFSVTGNSIQLHDMTLESLN